jgi:anti-sigma factor RsiW
MRCGDLERYLEAFLDGRLGRSRGAVLRRHLAMCAACQARVERLRQFERDTQRRFRSPEQPGSVWEGLELHLVGSNGAVGGRLLAAPRGLPSLPGGEAAPERPAPRRAGGHPLVAARAPVRGTASRLAGVLLVAVALGASYQLVRREIGSTASGTAAQVYAAFRHDRAPPMLSSDDARQVADWLATELGRPVPTPAIPDGYHLVGATRADLASGTAGVLIYALIADAEAAPVMLFVRPDPVAAVAPAAQTSIAGLQEVQWAADSLSYTAVGPFPEDQLLRFQR